MRFANNRPFASICLAVSVCTCFLAGKLIVSAQNPDDKPSAESSEDAARFPQAGYVLPLNGRLMDGKGQPLPKGNYEVLVSLYSATEHDATPDCSSGIQINVDDNGDFASHLELDRFPDFQPKVVDGRVLYLGVRVVTGADGKPMIESVEMSPRVCIWPVLFSKNAGLLDGHSWEEIDRRLNLLEAKTQHLSVPDLNRDLTPKTVD